MHASRILLLPLAGTNRGSARLSSCSGELAVTNSSIDAAAVNHIIDDDGRLKSTVRRVAQGEVAALHDLYTATSGRLFGLCLRIAPGRQDAEDVLQEIYLTIWRRAATFDPGRGSAMGWLVAIARNHAIDRLRLVTRVSIEPIEPGDDVPDAAPLASDLVEQRQETGRLLMCMDRLGPFEARLIRSAFYEGATYAELASRAATPLGTIKSKIRRALLKLRECMQ
ncbi:sigma-70 family RNA polymerase sigma factor [Sphingomonas nostoxanthinifaciens]|uniref:sigma-70 family RNA polymerase sigma factor n=1 Tax=Sphingomonas nostoxanthinifaciens TaxID=2872652 RepID=UPI001CC1FD43|nr:sigma-70 family RNA polymerase sigma factor [Sphingomonas nostoxanthinifaciens]UAK23174.1 sigma-70 family RNA polymerase sigma factor [Sphingomonas nostoxanthinifaciens]